MKQWKELIAKCPCLRPGLVLVAVALLVLFGIIPLRKRIAEESDETQKVIARMEHSRERIINLGGYRSQGERIREYGSGLDLSLPESDFASFISELEQSARESGGEISVGQGPDLESIRKGGKESGADASEARLTDELSGSEVISLIVRFSGTYPETIDFLHRMETLPYFLDVLSLNLSAEYDRESSRGSSVSGVFFAGTEAAEPEESELSDGPVVNAEFDLIIYSS